MGSYAIDLTSEPQNREPSLCKYRMTPHGSKVRVKRIFKTLKKVQISGFFTMILLFFLQLLYTSPSLQMSATLKKKKGVSPSILCLWVSELFFERDLQEFGLVTKAAADMIGSILCYALP